MSERVGSDIERLWIWMTLSLIDFESIFKGSSDPNHFIFKINVGNSRIRHRTTLNLNDEFLDRVKIDWIFKFRVVLCRIRLFPTLISKIKWIWSVLPLIKWSILGATWWPIENQPWFEFHDFIRYISFSLCFSPFKVNFRSLNPLFSINMSSFTD